jgi:hypothetical protein
VKIRLNSLFNGSSWFFFVEVFEPLNGNDVHNNTAELEKHLA